MSPAPKPLRHEAAAGIVFLASAAVLVLEILGVRLLAPYVGLTLETTTSIIGAVLAGIAAGAAWGGRAADSVSPRRLLPALLVGGGLLAFSSVPIVRSFGPSVQGGGDLAALALTCFALLPSAAVLSAVTPAVARLQLSDLASSGTVYGRFSAWATAGALAGTFSTGFVLVPLLPVSASVSLVGGALVLSGLALALRVRLSAPDPAVGILVGTLAFAGLALAASPPCDAESTYHCARIVDDPSNPGGRTLVLDDVRHSYVDLRDPRRLEFDYTRWIGDGIDAQAPKGRPLRAVFVGGGGFTLPRYLAATRPGSRSTVLEVDGELVDLAKERLGLRTSPALRVIEGDARMTFADLPSGSAGLVVGDAFGGRTVPWHLATREWTRDVRRVLRDDGLYAVNVIDGGPENLLKAEAATLLEAFADVRLVAPLAEGGNFVLLASESPMPARLASSARGARTLRRAQLKRFVGGAEPLRDDDAPADQLLSG